MKLNILFGFIMLCWLAVPLQSYFPYITSMGVKGAFEPAPDTTFTWRTWWNGTYQKQKNAYWNDHVGFHSDFVRINNQLDYSLFGVLHAKTVVEGKGGCLYERGYITLPSGEHFMGTIKTSRKVRLLSALRDSLAKRNIPVLFVLAPNKARIYPEFIPDSIRFTIADSSNYNVLLTQLKQYDIPHIDVIDWFVKIKPQVPHPLNSLYGTHWSSYGVALFADSLSRYINKIGLYAPKVTYKIRQEKNPLTIMKSSEYDIAQGLNLILPLPGIDSIACPVYTYKEDTTKAKITPVFLSDSFFWMLMNDGVSRNLFSPNYEFWNYGHDVVVEGKPWRRHNIETAQSELYDKSMLIIISSESNMTNVGFGLFGW